MKIGDKTKAGDKIVEVFKVPKWFLGDVNRLMNAVLKKYKVNITLTTHTRSEIEQMVAEMDHLEREDMSYLKNYFASLKQSAWAKFALLNKKARDYETMVYDPDENEIYAIVEEVEERVTTATVHKDLDKEIKKELKAIDKKLKKKRKVKSEDDTIKALKPNKKKND